MLRILFSKGGRKIDASDFEEAWEEISRFKESNEAKECPHFVGLQDEHGRMVLLALYDRDRWVLETLEGDWDTEFGRMDLARDFKVQETFLSDEELKRALKTFMAEGSLTIPS